MKREYHEWFSPSLNRPMELLVFGHAGARAIVFPCRMGRFFDYENWGLVEALRPSIEAGRLQLYCVDSIDAESIYNVACPPRQRIARHQQFEHYILRELLPFTLHLNDNPFAIAHGCSLGAYHAVNLAFRHPHLFRKVVALSGRYDLTLAVEHFRNLFDDYYDDAIYFHTPSHFLPNLHDESILQHLRQLEITLAIGHEDPFLDNNRHLSHTLHGKHIGHTFHCMPGRAHKARAWREVLPEVL